jgi:hypothetical protein
MRKLALILAIAMLPVLAMAQTATPPDSNSEAIDPNVGIHFESFTEVVKFTNGHGTGTDAGFRIPITGKNSLIADVIAAPSAGSTFSFGQWDYRVRLDHVFPRAKVLIPLNAIQFWARGGLGVRRGVGVRSPEFAYTGKVGLAFAAAKIGNAPVIFNLGAGILGSRGLKLPSFTNVGDGSLGLSVRF